MMAKNRYRKATIGNAVSLALLAGQASLAQEQSAQAAEPIEEIVVTGSQIRGARTTGALPVTVLGRDQIQDMGGVSGEDLYRALPQAGDVSFNTQTLNGGSQGAARGDVSSINLRGIGPGYTLVLLNGRRMVPHPTSQGQQEFTYNANTIPIFALERLEILRDGAAALYGADAVAGVVNNVLRSDYEGFRVEAQYGAAEGTNLDQLQLNALWGTSVFGGRG
jgi:outer membrane receptor for ferrienterochelin and colicin